MFEEFIAREARAGRFKVPFAPLDAAILLHGHCHQKAFGAVVSLQMAEASLLPALRRAPDAIAVADGTSCRQQIAYGAGREALHVARLLERQLL